MSTTCEGKFQVGYEGEFTERISIFSEGSVLISALNSLETLQSSGLTITNTSYSAEVNSTVLSGVSICQAGQRRNHTIIFNGPAGNLPRLELFGAAHGKNDESVFSTDNFTSVLKIYSNDGRNDAVSECNGIGTCDYATGLCSCPYGWGPSATKGPCGAPVINTSDWQGITRCPGTVSYPDREDWSDKRNIERIYIAVNPGDGFNNGPYTTSSIVMYALTYTGKNDLGDPAHSDYEYDYPRVNASTKETVYNFTNTTAAGALALDRSRGHLYFASNVVDDYFIGLLVLNTNGTAESSSSWLTVSAAIYDLAIDADMFRRKIFWSIPDHDDTFTPNGKIQWEYLDASSPSANDLTASIGQAYVIDPKGIAVHHYDEKLYWVDIKQIYGTNYSVLRSCDFDGSGYAEIVIYDDEEEPLLDAKDIVIDFINNSLFFTGISSGSSNNFTIYQTNLDFPSYIWRDFNNGTYNETYNSEFIVKKIRSTSWLSIDDPAYMTLEFDSRVLIWSDPDLYSIKYMDTTRDGNNTAIDQYSGTVWNFDRNYMPAYMHLVENWEKPYGIAIDHGLSDPNFGKYLNCYGNGYCLGYDGNYKCECDKGFFGNCKLRSCPTGPAWFHEPIVDNYAHDINVECSNAGVCDYNTGECLCHQGYEGYACERSTCEDDCNGNGRCFSMRELASKRRNDDLTTNATTYGKYYHDQGTWDADMVFGCYADEYGYSESIHNISSYIGQSLDELECPYGYDKRLADSANSSIGESAAISLEVQSLLCLASSGTFQLSFRGETTEDIAYSATLFELESALEALSTIGDVTILASKSNQGNMVCHSGGNSMNVTFNTELGDVPLLTSNIGLIVIEEVVASSGALYECSGRGDCDRTTGQCKCWDNRVSSDGKGNAGRRGDCGYYMT